MDKQKHVQQHESDLLVFNYLSELSEINNQLMDLKTKNKQPKQETIKVEQNKKGLEICGEILQMLAKHKQPTLEE